MQIERYTKQKNGQYKLSLDNNINILLHEDLILKYDLLIHKNISEEEVELLLEENTSYIAYDLALSYLKVKMRSKREIEEYLVKKKVKEELINKVITMLEQHGYLNENNYTIAFINDKINLSNDGPKKIKDALLTLGIYEDTINSNMTLFSKELEEERIKKIIDKQVKINKSKSRFLLKKKITDYLINLGYSRDLIFSAVNSIDFDDNQLYKKEYDKIYKKLSSKYSGMELEHKIKQKMYQKGFVSERD